MKITSTDQLKHEHRFGDYLYWHLFFLIHVVAAFMAIVKHSPGWAITYLLVGVALVAEVMPGAKVDAIKATGRASRRLARLRRSRPGPAASAPASATINPIPLTISM